MSIDKNKITTQDELNEPAPMDQVEKRVEAEMKELEEKAKRDVREGLKNTGNATAAAAVGKAIAERAKAAGITQVAFDRSGFKFHGRIKALADAARENGLEF